MRRDNQLSPRMILLVPPRREERQRKDLDYGQCHRRRLQSTREEWYSIEEENSLPHEDATIIVTEDEHSGLRKKMKKATEAEGNRKSDKDYYPSTECSSESKEDTEQVEVVP